MTATAPYRLARTPLPAAPAPVLDDAQRRVVEHAGGPLLVVAGPGTGKTTTLVEAVAARVRRGVPVERILMLTFSRRAAHELRDRVAVRLDRTIREPVARTLHSYAFGILRLAAARDGQPAPRLLASAEQDVLIRDLLAEGSGEPWPPALRLALRTLGFADELRNFLMRAVERGIDGEDLARLGHTHERPDWVAAGRFLAEYHGVTVLKDPGGYDPAEIIAGALGALRQDPELLAAERDRRRHLFVDEYQDTDPAQAQLLHLLAATAEEVVLVGDPDQSIYAFRGADEAAMRDVDERFGGGRPVPRVALTLSRRSGPVLLAASRRLAARLPGPAEHRRVAAVEGAPPGQAQVAVFRSASEEAAYLAGVLRRAYLDGTPWSRMAVLVRSTAQTLGVLRRALNTAGVPVTVRGADIPLAEQPAVTALMALLGCVLAPEQLDEELAEALITGPLGGADSLYLRRLRRTLRQQYPGEAGELAAVLRDRQGADALPPPMAGPVLRVARALAAGQNAVSAGQTIESVLWAIWDSSGLAARWEAASVAGGPGGAAADRSLDAIVQLFQEAAAFTDRLPHVAPAAFVDYLRAQQLPGPVDAAEARRSEAVTLLTAHAAKGLEWDVVCVAHVQEGSWPDLRRRGSLLGIEELLDAVNGVPVPVTASIAPQLAEERRLFYVAITRARSSLFVTAVAGEEEQPSRFLDDLDPSDGDRPLTRPLRGVHLPGLVAELRAVATEPGAPTSEREAAAAALARLAASDVAGADPDDWWGLAELSTAAGVAEPDRPVRISPSRVESFVDCELRTLLQLLGVRDDEAAAASLGTVIHDLASGRTDSADLAELEGMLDEQWSQIDFGAAWFAANERARASKMLHRLVDWLTTSRNELSCVGVEQEFRAEVGDALLVGRVDRVERDREGRLVIIDLKTGKSKPRDVAVHPQLGAYQLAVEAGAFGPAGDRSGGARLVQLGTAGAVEQNQPPLADAEDPGWARTTIDEMAARLRGFEFSAKQNSRCHICDVRSCCPLQLSGRQVTQ